MQRDRKKTKLTVYAEEPAGICSSLNGANVSVIGFNMDYIVQYNQELALMLIKLYREVMGYVEKPTLIPKNDSRSHKKLMNELTELIIKTNEEQIEEYGIYGYCNTETHIV